MDAAERDFTNSRFPIPASLAPTTSTQSPLRRQGPSALA